MSTTHEPDVDETEIIDGPVVEHRVERVERLREPGYVAPASPTNVSVNPYAPVWTVTRVITLLFTVLEVVLLIRLGLKLLGANAQQPLVNGLYAITEPLVRPFEGIWPQDEHARRVRPDGAPCDRVPVPHRGARRRARAGDRGQPDHLALPRGADLIEGRRVLER
jgi:hypothetical protein